MSASAGKVMPRPMGNYNAATEYKVLDIVTYNDRPYMAKQTTQGNLPTNTTYWMLLLDFPTEVDNVPTQNSQNLVRSGGVYNSVNDRLLKDGSNSGVINLYGDHSGANLSYTDFEKAAGANESVTFTPAITNLSLDAQVALLSAHVGNEFVTSISGFGDVTTIIDSVTDDGTDITVTGHLKVDETAAMSKSIGTGTLKNYTTNNEVIFLGDENAAVGGDAKLIIGNSNSVDNDRPALIVGVRNVIDSRHGTAIGRENYVHGLYSTVLGLRNTSEHDYQTVIGYNNNNKTGTVFEVGSGPLTGSPKNAFEVYQNGAISQDDGSNLFKFTKVSGRAGYYDGSNVFHPLDESIYLTDTLTLSTSANTSVTFTNAAILETSILDVYTDEFGTNPIDCTVASGGGSASVTFGKVSTAHTIGVKLKVVNI